MLKIDSVRIPYTQNQPALLKSTAARRLSVDENKILSVTPIKRSLDARRKNDIHYIYSIAVKADINEDKFLKNNKSSTISKYAPKIYAFPYAQIQAPDRPVVVGAGPAGLFAAYCLAKAGLKPILIERGRKIEERSGDVEQFWKTGVIDPKSNVQFGEGGAGTFSDGKLTTGINDERIGFVLDAFIRFGAPDDIRYVNKPHIGTDVLKDVITSMRNELIELGAEVYFNTQLINLKSENDKLNSITLWTSDGTKSLNCTSLILAIGNSARDTFEMLEDSGISMEQKAFAVGVRIEHKQSAINTAQYGEAATLGTLPASDYKLAVHLPNGHSVFTFCVCPGGRVVAAASEPGGVVTNGMSYRSRDLENCNGGLLVSVSEADFGSSLMNGVLFQRSLEQKAFEAGGSNYHAPAQLVSDFLAHRPSSKAGSVLPSYAPGVCWGNLWDVLPEFICESLAEALPLMEKKIQGFSCGDAVLTAVETRSSCPIRILRDENAMASLKGLFPAGEGAGYAGGIMSAAVDGIRCAEALCQYLLS